MDLSKVFYAINHDVLIAKLHFYGVLGVIETKRELFELKMAKKKQNPCFSKWTEILLRELEGYALGVLWFNIYILDLFIFVFFS